MERRLEIDVPDVLRQLWRMLPVLALAAVIGGLAALNVSRIRMTRMFDAYTQIYVVTKEVSDEEALNVNDLQAGAQILKDCQRVIRSRDVLGAVIAQLDLTSDGVTPVTVDNLAGELSITFEEESRIIVIGAMDSNPYLACDLANTVREVAVEQLVDLLDVKEVRTVEEACVPTESCRPRTGLNCQIGALFGFAAACMAVFLLDLRRKLARAPQP